MTRLPFLFVLFSILNCATLFSQTREVKLYTGFLDRLGLAYESPINERTSFEIGASFNSSKIFYSFGASPSSSGERDNLIYLNAKLKRYFGDLSQDTRFFYGGYLRYFRYAAFSSDMETWTAELKEHAKNNNVVLSERTHKISIGALLGMKGKLFKSFTWELTVGAGFSPPPLYFSKSEGTLRTESGPVGPVESEAGHMLPGGYFYHLSLLGHISIGYSF